VLNPKDGDVVVNLTSLSEAQRAQIEDIVKRKTDISADKIVITTVSSQ
jgi:stage III sporulation protein AH